MTLGTWLFTKMRGDLVGTDAEGNRYYQDRRVVAGRRRKRWVVYKGEAEATRVPPDWHGWLHFTYKEPPTVAPLKVKPWEKRYVPNLTGTEHAYRPAGSLTATGKHAPATGDYEPWVPE